jgi:hypothetical protein
MINQNGGHDHRQKSAWNQPLLKTNWSVKIDPEPPVMRFCRTAEMQRKRS